MVLNMGSNGAAGLNKCADNGGNSSKSTFGETCPHTASTFLDTVSLRWIRQAMLCDSLQWRRH